MPIDGLTDDDIHSIFRRTRRIALVGASNRPERPSFGVMAFLLGRGFNVVPVNPGLSGQQILGQVVVGSLDEAGPLDLVDIFRNPESVGPVVEDAVRLGARTIWMQLGVVNEAAAECAHRAGLMVAMDRCPKIEFFRLGIG
jgi:predicted CoA-binding protein